MKYNYPSFFSLKHSKIFSQKILFVLLLGIGLLSFDMQSAFAQNSSPSLRLKSSTEKYVSNTEEFIQNKNDFADALFGSHYFMVVQFTTLPSHQERQNLKNKGVELIQYLPDLSYTAKIKSTIPSAELESLVRDFKIHAFVRLSTAQKTESRLMQGDIPTWAIPAPNQVVLNIFLLMLSVLCLPQWRW